MNFKNTFIKKTKIVATAGPTFEDVDTMKEMFKRGVNTIRLNVSHGDMEEHAKRIINCKLVRVELDLPITILLDTKGPEIRVHTIENKKMTVKMDDILTIHCHEEIVGKDGEFSVTYKDLPTTVEIGQKIFFDDGKLSTEVIAIDKTAGIVKVKTLNSHFIGTKKAVNVPGVVLTLSFIAEHDKKFIIWGIQQGIDVVAASFVRDANDVKELRKFLDENDGEHVKIMSKIEALQAIKNLNEIISESDSIMLARGDLGVEIPYYEVPFYEKLIISKCRAWGKPVVVATQMLDSMMDNPRATRAEVTDVYFAAISGTDSTMLSGESASGNYPTMAVETMARVNFEAEINYNYLQSFEDAYANVDSRNAESAYKVAKLTLFEDVKLIVAFSEKGRLVNALARFRPKIPILALLGDKKLVTSYGYTYGVYAALYNNVSDYNNDEKIFTYLKEAGVEKGKIIVANKNDYRIIDYK